MRKNGGVRVTRDLVYHSQTSEKKKTKGRERGRFAFYPLERGKTPRGRKTGAKGQALRLDGIKKGEAREGGCAGLTVGWNHFVPQKKYGIGRRGKRQGL